MQKEGWVFHYDTGDSCLGAFIGGVKPWGIVNSIDSISRKDNIGVALNEFAEHIKECFITNPAVDWNILKEQGLSLSLYWRKK